MDVGVLALVCWKHSRCAVEGGYACQRISTSDLLMLCYTMPYATVYSKFPTPSPCKKQVDYQKKKKEERKTPIRVPCWIS